MYKTRHDLVSKVINGESNKKSEMWPFEQMVYAQPRTHPEEWDAQTPSGFWDTNGSPNNSKTTRRSNNQQRELADWAISADHRVKLKENEMKVKYLDLPRELKKLWNMKVTEIPIVIGALLQSPKDWYNDWKTWK